MERKQGFLSQITHHKPQTNSLRQNRRRCRALAKDLRVSVITTKRAYEELEKAGYLYTVPAKGSYVAEKNTQLVREAYLTQIEEHMTEILSLADSCGLGEEELLQMFRLLYETHA